MKRRHYKKRSRGMSKKEVVGWIIVFVVFIFGFIIYFIYNFWTNCVWEWPIRWDVGTCWEEQKTPAIRKAFDTAINVVP